MDQKRLKEIKKNKQFMTLEFTEDNINTYYNGQKINEYTSRLILIKWNEVKFVRGIIGNRSIKYGNNSTNIKCSFDISNGCKVEEIFLKIDDKTFVIKEGKVNYIEIMIYLRSENTCILVNGDYNLFKKKYQLRKLVKFNDDIYDLIISQKIRNEFPQLYEKLGEVENE